MDLGLVRSTRTCSPSIELIKATVDSMIARGFGRIVNITSSAVKAPIDVLGLSKGARSGLTGFVAGLARKVVAHNVTINNLLPGQFATDRLRAGLEARAQASGNPFQEVRDAAMRATPAGRFGDPQEFGERSARSSAACTRGTLPGRTFWWMEVHTLERSEWFNLGRFRSVAPQARPCIWMRAVPNQ